MPERMISAMLPVPGLVMLGSKNQMNGNSSSPMNAVNSSCTATPLCLKSRSTRYLSKCTEIAQSTGPENAKRTQDIDQDIDQDIGLLPVPRTGTGPLGPRRLAVRSSARAETRGGFIPRSPPSPDDQARGLPGA